MADTVMTVSSRALLRACEALGLDTQVMLDAAGLQRSTVDDPDARIDVQKVRALWKKAFELSGDPYLALHAAEAVPMGAYKVIDVMASMAPTIGACLTSLAAYFPLINTALETPVQAGPDVATFGVRCPSSPALLTREYAEYTLAAVVLRSRLGIRADFQLRAVEFTHAPPPSTAEHERIFHCPVRFAAQACQLVIDRAVWDAPNPSLNPPAFEVVKDHASLLLRQLPEAAGPARAVRTAIRRELRGGNPSLEHVARQLGMSARTLQRRLRDAGESFGDVLDEVRRAASTAYLDDRELALSEMAWLLGFAEQSSFTRAFKRWMGVTPREYRSRAQGRRPAAPDEA